MGYEQSPRLCSTALAWSIEPTSGHPQDYDEDNCDTELTKKVAAAKCAMVTQMALLCLKVFQALVEAV